MHKHESYNSPHFTVGFERWVVVVSGGGSSFEAKAGYKDRHKSRGLFEDARQYAEC